MSEIYYVWRRHPDGYINASAGGMPCGWETSAGVIISFEQLGKYNNWPDASKQIEEERKTGLNVE